jgi:Mrp family chromosome partitioning ATPase
VLFGDILPLVRHVDGVIVVVKLYHTRKRALRNLVRSMDTAGVRPIGIVLVGTSSDSDSFYGY